MSKEIMNYLMNHVSKERKCKILKLKNDSDKYRSLLSELLIRCIVCEELYIPYTKINFMKNSYGKPYLADYQDFHFNLSHSEEWVVCVVSNCPAGIDIEKVKPIEYRDLSERFFTDEECRFIFNTSPNKQLDTFYRLWTLKESYVKADGRGLLIPLNSFIINLKHEIFTSNRLKKCFFKEFQVIPEYKMSVCSVSNNITNNIEIVSQNDLFNKSRVWQ